MVHLLQWLQTALHRRASIQSCLIQLSQKKALHSLQARYCFLYSSVWKYFKEYLSYLSNISQTIPCLKRTPKEWCCERFQESALDWRLISLGGEHSSWPCLHWTLVQVFIWFLPWNPSKQLGNFIDRQEIAKKYILSTIECHQKSAASGTPSLSQNRNQLRKVKESKDRSSFSHSLEMFYLRQETTAKVIVRKYVMEKSGMTLLVFPSNSCCLDSEVK